MKVYDAIKLAMTTGAKIRLPLWGHKDYIVFDFAQNCFLTITNRKYHIPIDNSDEWEVYDDKVEFGDLKPGDCFFMKIENEMRKCCKITPFNSYHNAIYYMANGGGSYYGLKILDGTRVATGA